MLSGSQSSRVVWGAFRFFATRQNAEKDFFRSFTTVPVSIQHIFGLHALRIVADFVESIKEFMWYGTMTAIMRMAYPEIKMIDAQIILLLQGNQGVSSATML